jgi:hypothetical protein
MNDRLPVAIFWLLLNFFGMIGSAYVFWRARTRALNSLSRFHLRPESERDALLFRVKQIIVFGPLYLLGSILVMQTAFTVFALFYVLATPGDGFTPTFLVGASIAIGLSLVMDFATFKYVKDETELQRIAVKLDKHSESTPG